ncbi:hypothetical protein CCHR01_17319 [Colletotrichum chrysophilum]|uniref:Uncharacterized protein n=1 Tax=Colletotrichum chrysophilum TaxID=1836956 RepID=A0AAD9A2Q8_9PEZI|nr:hypothetical protein CCHR01_17319 [Colletotrichum chrysophilum]
MVGNRVDKSACWSTPTRQRDPEKVTWRLGKRIPRRACQIPMRRKPAGQRHPETESNRQADRQTYRQMGWRAGSIKVSSGEVVTLGKQIDGLRLVGLTPCCCHPVPSLPPSYAYAGDCDSNYGGGTVIVWARAARPFRPPEGASFQPIRLLLQRDHHYETANGMQ